MAEEKIDYADETFVNMDDMSVLRELLHGIKGLSVVSGGELAMVPVEEGLENE